MRVFARVFHHVVFAPIMFGRVMHLVVDAMLISVVLSGIKRNTGLTLSLARIPNRDLRKFFSAYLEAGEWVGWAALTRS